jgi:drug/metabolite transporter (DMT)-like permease
MSSLQRGILYGLLAAAIWGGMYVVSDGVLRVIPPFTLLTIRLLLGIATLAVFLQVRRRSAARASTTLSPQSSALSTQFILVGLLGFGVSVGLQFVGTDLSDAVNGALITSASPAFILLFAALILRERLTLIHIAAVALATIGVIVIIDPGQADFSSTAFAGNIALVFAALTWGLFSVLSRRVGQEQDTLSVTLYGFIGGLVLTIPAALIELQTRSIGQIDFNIVLGILYLGVVSTAGALWLWNRAFALVDASTASLTFFAQPLVGALLAAAIGQAITPALIIGGILIALGVLLALRR